VKFLSVSTAPELLGGEKTSVRIDRKWYYGSFHLQLGPGSDAVGARAGSGCSELSTGAQIGAIPEKKPHPAMPVG